MNTFNDSKILKNALVGVEFEFYSNLPIEETAKKIGSLLDKKIQVETKAHSDFEPTADHFKIEPDMSGGIKLMELVTGPMPYYNARLLIINVSKWIEENGYTNDRTSIHLNLSFDKNKIENKNRISKMNVLKFILDFKEDQVFKFFPGREGSAYAKSVKFILPNKDTYFFDGNTINQQNFTYPDSKYYGINFDKRHKNYLEFRYIGGKDWEKKTTTVLHMLDQFLVQLWNSTESTQFNSLNALELKKILAKNQRIISARKDWRSIEKNWKNIQFTVDLQKHPEILDLHWSNIKEQVMRLFTHGDITKGHINYDTDTSKVQIDGGELSYCVEISGYDFVSSKIKGELKHCDFFRCTLDGSDISDCNFYDNCEIISSKVKNSYVHQSCELNDVYIYGTTGIMKGKMTGGIFREGKYDKKTAKFNGTEKILYTEV
tara:strand:- start:49506 stop:50801 length:1296 start_codon:yes stop_codon:yes gene_type:complete